MTETKYTNTSDTIIDSTLRYGFIKELNEYDKETLIATIINLFNEADLDGKAKIIHICRESTFPKDTDVAELNYAINDLKVTIEKAKEMLNKVYGIKESKND